MEKGQYLTVHLKGWWWKRFFPKHREMRRLMQWMMNRTYEENKERINKKILNVLVNGYDDTLQFTLLRKVSMENELKVRELIRAWYKGQGQPCMCLGDCKECNFHSCSGCLCGIAIQIDCLYSGDHLKKVGTVFDENACGRCGRLDP